MDGILDSFNGNKDKAMSWWMTPNPFFDDRIPFEMVKKGDTKELMTFIRTRLCDEIK